VPDTDEGADWLHELRSKPSPTAIIKNRFSTRAQASRQNRWRQAKRRILSRLFENVP
jgi:hypothetical protein